MCKPMTDNRDWYAPFGDDNATDSGFKVIGPNTSNGEISVWHYNTVEDAKNFAQHLCRSVGENVLVVELVGRYRPVVQPVEFITNEDK